MAALDGFEGFLFEPYSFLSLTVAIYDWHIPVVLTQRCIPLPNSLFHIIVFFFSPFVVLDVHICHADDQNTAIHPLSPLSL
jgi:hypothetical protein